jgi:uncharacterized protein
MKKSSYLQSVGSGDSRLYYHSLFGNLFLLQKEYIEVLEDENPSRFIGEKDDIISELINSYYLVDRNIDERFILAQRNDLFLKKVVSGGNVTSLDLNISELCNFTCPHCMNGCQIQSKKNKLMKWEVAKVAIDEYARIINRRNLPGEIHFGSAEPLINWKLIKQVVNYCKENLPETPISINTNLSLLDEEKAKFLKDNGVYIASSLDGPKDGNDAIRTRKVGGTYETIIDKINLLKSIDHSLDGISITMNDLNIDYIDESFILFLKNLGFTGVATDIDLVNTKNCSRNVDFYVDKIITIHDLCKLHGMYNFGSWSLIYSNLVNQDGDEPITYCKSQSGRNISVNPEGNVFLCGYSTSMVGNINNIDTLFDQNSYYVNLISSKLPGMQSRCMGCQLEGICSGQCLVTHEFNQKTKKEENKLDFLCEFYKRCTSKLLDIKLQTELLTI